MAFLRHVTRTAGPSVAAAPGLVLAHRANLSTSLSGHYALTAARAVDRVDDLAKVLFTAL